MMTKLKETVGAYGTNTEFQLGFPVKPETTNYPPVRPLICLYKANAENNRLKGKTSSVKYKHRKIFHVSLMRKRDVGKVKHHDSAECK